MLRDEATERLFEWLEKTEYGALRLYVDHGEYTASVSSRAVDCEGEPKPTLSDALVSLVEVLDG